MKKWNQLAYSSEPITAFKTQLNDLYIDQYIGIYEATRNENKKISKGLCWIIRDLDDCAVLWRAALEDQPVEIRVQIVSISNSSSICDVHVVVLRMGLDLGCSEVFVSPLLCC